MDKMIFNSIPLVFMRISTQNNEEPWKRLDELCGARNTSWRWVRGHNDNLGNERADILANKGIDQMRSR